MKKKIFIFFLELLTNFHLKRVFKFFKKKKLKIIFDVGSYKGEFVDIFANEYKNAKFYLFEPMQESFFYLKKKFKNKKNICIINKGICDKNMVLPLNVNVTSNASTFSEMNDNAFFYKLRKFLLGEKKLVIKKEICKLTSLDEFTKKNNVNNIDLLKIDVEGFEFKALKGAKDILKKTKYILIEITFSNIFKNYDNKKIDYFLKQIGFKKERRYLFPILNFEDRIYKNLNINLL
jgi:FkbM family methyltransferase